MEAQGNPPIYTTSKRAIFLWFAFLLLLIGIALGVLILPRILAEIRYPLEYDAIVVREALDHDLDPYLVAAVIYSESRFRSDATSPVGARGLMQLMPATAAGIARRMGDSAYSLDKLYDPAINIKYGTYHLQGLMGRYSSNVEPALVAYNGGGGAGDRYLAGNRDGVPGESLNYVRKVLDAKAKYEELYPARLNAGQALDQFFRPAAQEPLVDVLLRAIQSAVTSRLSS